MPFLNPGDRFPDLSVTVAGAGDIELPGALAGSFGVILFNRGSWCPYCNAQLRALQRASESLGQLGVRVVSLSVDDEATTKELIAKHGLTFPVGYGADARAIAEATGAFIKRGPDIPAGNRVRARSRQSRDQRVFQRGHRPAGPGRRRRPDPLLARARV
jgi:peroxiredoxin